MIESGPASESQEKRPSLEESFETIPVPKEWSWWKKMLAFAGPGYLVAVGYMDPGNWATDLAGGSQFGYTLLSVILISNLIAIVLQSLAGKLGIATGRDLAQSCRDHYSKTTTYFLWIVCEIAICACDLAEVIGSAIALNLLFGLPLLWGVLVTALDVFVILYLQRLNFRSIEFFVIGLMLFIGGCFAYEIFLSNPSFSAIFAGFIPHAEIITNHEMLYISIGILGATVMPHNLYLHSSIVQTRKYEKSSQGKKEAVKFVTIDSTVALMAALFVNAAILIMAASVFHETGNTKVAEIQDAFNLLTPILNAPLASTVFALALLASGQNSTLTGTLAGQIVMEGFLDIRLRPWIRRLITRAIAIVPALITVAYFGDGAVTNLLIFSQAVLSFQLAFAVVPLIVFTSDRKKMGELVNRTWLKALAWIFAGLIIFLNGKFLFEFVWGYVV